MSNIDRPFNTIESAHEYLSILSEQIEEVLNDVRAEIAAATDRKQERRAEAWQLVIYTLTKLSFNTASSRRLLNDLRTLRNLLSRTTAPDPDQTSGVPEDARPSESDGGSALKTEPAADGQ